MAISPRKKKWMATGIFAVFIVSLIALALSDGFNEYVGVLFANRYFAHGYALAKITSIQIHTLSEYNLTVPVQDLEVQILTGSDVGKNIGINNEGLIATNYNQPMHVGEVVVISKSPDDPGTGSYILSDRFRLPSLTLILIGFIVAIIFVARWRGFASLLGLGVSGLVLVGFVVPAVIHGANPLWAVFAGAIVIAVASLYLAHGFNRKTSVAVLGAVTTVIASLAMVLVFAYAANVAGIGSEDALSLASNINNLNFAAFFMGAVLIGALGVLADVAIGQSATVQELHDADPEFGPRELYRRGMSVGREHIASLVNTLALAYAGTSFPVIFFFVLDPERVPYWSILNGEQIADVFIQTIVGSLALVLAVPITTFLASRFFGKKGT